LANTGNAQDLSVDSQTTALSLSYPARLYNRALGENAHIYNGYEYLTSDPSIIGMPFFKTDTMSITDIYYDGGYYPHIPALYDLVRDLLVINRLDQNYRLFLISDKLQSFSLLNHHFIRIHKDSLQGIDLVSGFYDRMYNGKSTILVRRKKSIEETVLYSSSTRSYFEENFYFIKFQGKYVQVKNKSAVLNLFKGKKSEIKSFIRKNKLDFKTNFEQSVIAATSYYDQLTS
jgi:hypothetical protein